MKYLILAAIALIGLACSSHSQTIKSLGYDTTNGKVIYGGTNTLTFTNPLQFESGVRAATRTNLELGATWLTNTNVTNFRTAIGLGATNNVTFSNITASGIITAKDSTASPATNSTLARGIQWANLGGSGVAAIYGSYPGVPQIYLAVGATNALTDVATFRATGMTVASNAIVGGTLAVSNTATFSTNVTVNGNISVGSLTTTTPSTWALDATQTAAATNGILALPSNANVIRLTNNNAISSVTNGVLGAFYYLVNQATNAVTISNVGGITIDGAQNLTLSPNESATLVATGATNASVAARGDLNNVTLTGVDNLATQQTASSASSLMTRALTDQRQIDRMIAGPRMVWLTTFTGWETAVSGGSVAQNIFLRPSSGTNQWNYAIARSWQSGELFTGSADVLNFSKAGGYGTALYSPGADYRNGTGIIYLGAAYDYLPSTGSAVSNPATKGFGWRIKDESIVATMFNTNYVEVGTNSAVLSSGATTRQNVWLYIDWNGSGGATWYVNGSSVASTTNGPTGATSVNQGYLIFGAVADVGLAQQNGLSISAFVLDREP